VLMLAFNLFCDRFPEGPFSCCQRILFPVFLQELETTSVVHVFLCLGVWGSFGSAGLSLSFRWWATFVEDQRFWQGPSQPLDLLPKRTESSA